MCYPIGSLGFYRAVMPCLIVPLGVKVVLNKTVLKPNVDMGVDMGDRLNLFTWVTLTAVPIPIFKTLPDLP